MSERGALWRAILWVERFLPEPRPMTAEVDRPGSARRRGMFVMPFAILSAVMPMLVRQRHELDEIVVRNRVAVEQLALVFTCCVGLATVGFAIHVGTKAWRDAKGAR